MVTSTFEHWAPGRLKNHSRNLATYGGFDAKSKADAEFIESCRIGIIVPLVCLPDGTLISGHRRRAAAIILKMKDVPVIVRRDLDDNLEIEKLLILSNRGRVKTNEQIAREAARLTEIEAEFAARRQKSTQLGTVVAPVPPPEKHAGNGQDGMSSGGKTRDIVSEALGVGAKTAERAAKVGAAIEEAEAEGDTETAEDLKRTVNEQGFKPAADKIDGKTDKKPEDVLDALKGTVPKKLAAVFAERQEFVDVHKAIGVIRGRIETLAASPAGSRLELQECQRLATDLQGLVKFAAPHTECYRCRREPKRSCEHCRGTGWVTRAESASMSNNDKAWLEARK